MYNSYINLLNKNTIYICEYTIILFHNINLKLINKLLILS